jgi:hypothetical protein
MQTIGPSPQLEAAAWHEQFLALAWRPPIEGDHRKASFSLPSGKTRSFKALG